MPVSRNRSFNLNDKRRALLETLLQKEGVEVLRPDRIPKHDPNEPLHLSFAQERLWLINKLAPSSTPYNIATAIRLTGELDKAALAQSLVEVVRRHESLRTTFALDNDGRPVQVIAPPDLLFKMIERDLSNVPESEKEAEAKRLARITTSEPFELSQGPLLRAELLRLSDNDHVFVVATHHIVSDAMSVDLFVNEITTLYEAYSHGRTSPLPELTIQYADFAQWQRKKITSDVLKEQLAYWKDRLAGAQSVLALPTDRPRPLIESHRGALEDFELPASLLDAVRELSKQENATLFMTLLAAFQTLLSRYSGLKDIVVGTPIANRSKAELERLIGFFVNTLVIRTEFHDGENFRELLQRVRDTALAAYAHQDVPFEKLVEELQPQRNLGHQPIFQVLFTVQNMGERSGSSAFRGLRLKSLDFDSGTAAVDLAWIVEEKPNQFLIRVQYSTDLFDSGTIARMIANFETLLSAIVANPLQDLSKQPLLSERERRELLVEWNDTEAQYASELLAPQLFEYHAAQTPTAIAITCGTEQLMYGELNERANQLAHYLRSLGVGPEVLVGVCLDRSIEMIVGLLGVLKAGGAFVPLDPSYPLERLALMLEDSQAPVLLTQEQLADTLPAQSSQVICLDTDWDLIARQSAANPDATVKAENLAYVVYTSGSTGTPKGVMVQHGSLLNLVHWHREAYGVSASDRCTQLAGPSFDATVWELWPALCAGACVHLPGEETRLFSSELVQWLAEKQITISFLPTPLAEALLAEKWPEGMALRWLLTGGDKLHGPPPPGLPAALVNHYGPTENTVVSTSVLVPPSDDVTTAPPIGRPISNVETYIVDEQLQPVPIGVAGEVLVGGTGLARGCIARATWDGTSLMGRSSFWDEWTSR
jgi:amino acid adenylation domain-containing protein